MRILFLDDDPLRHEVIQEWAQTTGVEMISAHSIEEFEKYLDLYDRFDCIMLDHDLSDFGPATSKNGVDAARIVAMLPAQKIPQEVMIHSWNRKGALKMVEVLWARRDIQRVVIEEFDDRSYWTKMLQWYKEGKHHDYMQFLDESAVKARILNPYHWCGND